MGDADRTVRASLKRTWLRRLLDAGSASVVVATAVISLRPAVAEAATEARLEARVQAARESLQKILANPATAPGGSEKLIALWGNWGNGGWGWGVGHPWWHNWPNWHNWHNWNNWHNWGNG